MLPNPTDDAEGWHFSLLSGMVATPRIPAPKNQQVIDSPRQE
jgi:hypothetical protein